MSWAFKGASSVATGANPTITPPSNVAGDLLVIFAASETQYSTLSGWTELVRDNTNPRIALWWKISSGSEGNAALTNANSTSAAVMLCYGGIAASPYDALSAVASVSSTSIATNTLTTAEGNELIISFFASESTGNFWASAPSGTTNRLEFAPDTTNTGLLIVDENNVSAGTSTSRTATVSSASRPLKAVSVAFKQAPPVAASGLFFGSHF